jgi:hypothetical protein
MGVLGRAAAVAGTLIILALLVIAPGTARAATARPAGSLQSHAHAQALGPVAPAQPADTARLDAAADPSGGLCSVPGIGDIGSLLGLCQAGSSGLTGLLNNICSPGTPTPEYANSGLNTMIEAPGSSPGNGKTLYDNYGVAGQSWAAYGLQCSDMTSLIGNNVAGMVFDMAKALDRVTITIYQAAAGNGILGWLQGAVDKVITALGDAVYFPYLAPIVILGAIWLAWQGLIRKRATRTIEGTLWMIVAAAAAMWLIGRPADFTGVGTTVSNGVTQVLNVAFAKLPATQAGNCLPVGKGDPQSVTGNYAFTSGNGLVDENSNELWSVLVCEPWLYGEFGTTSYATNPKAPQTVVNKYGRALLWSQAIAANEQPSNAVIQAKQATYLGIAKELQQTDPATYTLFQGKQWTTRLEVGFASLFAAVAAGLLILVMALTLIVLKLGFLLLLVLGPFFLILGTHPGFGRVIAIRWFEMLAGVLIKQVAIALVLSVLLYCYTLIMGTSDISLPWALKIMMIALVTVAVFIYRKPFQHLFSAVGYTMIGSTERAQAGFDAAGRGFQGPTRTVTGMPRVAARWARRGVAAAAVGATAGAAAGVAAGAMTADSHDTVPDGSAPAADGALADAAAGRLRPESLQNDGEAAPDGSPPPAGSVPAKRGKNWPLAGGGNTSGRSAPPLPLPSSDGSSEKHGSSAGWARGPAARAGAGTGRGSAPPARSSGSSNGSSGNARPGGTWPNSTSSNGGVSSGTRSAGSGSNGSDGGDNGSRARATWFSGTRSNGGGTASDAAGGRRQQRAANQSGGTSSQAAPPARGASSQAPPQPPPAARRQGNVPSAPPVRRAPSTSRQPWPGGSGWFDGENSQGGQSPQGDGGNGGPAGRPAPFSGASSAAGPSGASPGAGSAAAGADQNQSLPFWLRPVRRGK